MVVFPAGAISTTPDKFGLEPAVDGRWQPFVSQLIQRSKATVVPIWFGGQNSRLFQIASHVSLTLRLSLIFHEVKTRIGTRSAGRDRRADSVRFPCRASKTGRRSPMSCAPASMRLRGLLHRPSTSRAGRSASSCGRSCRCRERTARPKAAGSTHAALSISARRTRCSLIMPRASFATLVSSRLSGDFR